MPALPAIFRPSRPSKTPGVPHFHTSAVAVGCLQTPAYNVSSTSAPWKRPGLAGRLGLWNNRVGAGLRFRQFPLRGQQRRRLKVDGWRGRLLVQWQEPLRTGEKLMTPTTTLDWNIPEQVQTFAEEQGIADCLPKILETTQRLFPTAGRRAVALEEDAEIPDLRYLVIVVDVAQDLSQAMALRHQWHDAVRQFCPSRRIGTFCLSLNPVA